MINKKSVIPLVNFTVYFIIIGFIIYAKLMSNISELEFQKVIREDGLAENLSFLFLAFGFVIFAFRTKSAIDHKKNKAIAFNLLGTFLFLFGAGEEISWGQRIFGFQAGEFFLENNYQLETNLHNLEIAGVDLNILIFSRIMFFVLLTYFILLPISAYKLKSIRRLVNDFEVPVPRLHHSVMLVLTNAAIPAFINLEKESELHELVLTGIMFLVLLDPAKTFKARVK